MIRQGTITFILSLFVSCVFAQDNVGEQQGSTTHRSYRKHFPKPQGYVNDFEGIFTNEEEHLLDSVIRVYIAERDIVISVVTLDSTYVSVDSFDMFTFDLANAWGVGEKSKDNGILIGVSEGYRKIRVNNGLGIEKVLSDNETKDIIIHDIIPYYREGKYFEGTVAGINAIAEILKDRLK